MTPINEVPVGKFCRFDGNVVYVHKNNFKDTYALIPIVGSVPRDKNWDHRVYVYKRIQKSWVEDAKKWMDELLEYGQRIDNLTYIENLAILKSYGI